MMDLGGIALAVMVLMMIAMCGGMTLAAAWVILGGRNRRQQPSTVLP